MNKLIQYVKDVAPSLFEDANEILVAFFLCTTMLAALLFFATIRYWDVLYPCVVQ